jgi:hypothetical protein
MTIYVVANAASYTKKVYINTPNNASIETTYLTPS